MKFKGMLHTLDECAKMREVSRRCVLTSERLKVSSDLDDTVFKRSSGSNPPSIGEIAQNYDGRVLNARYGLDGSSGKGFENSDEVLDMSRQPFESELDYSVRMKEMANPPKSD